MSEVPPTVQNMTELTDRVACDRAPPNASPAAPPPDGEPVVLGSLSPSRAADFKSCPLLYRFRCIDRLPEASSRAAVRGTLVHAVLEALFDLPPTERTLASARLLLPAAWERLCAIEPEVTALFVADLGLDGVAAAGDFATWMSSAAALLGNYFRLEDPTGFEPQAREEYLEFVTDGVRLRGIVDRLDELPDGAVRIVDYKTGFAPGESNEARALFQLKFYALLLWRTRGVVPRELRLVYLGDADTLSYEPDLEQLVRFESIVLALWSAIERALRTRDFPPSPGRVCAWCKHHAHCPTFGGTPPPFPQRPVLSDPRDDSTPAAPAVAQPPGAPPSAAPGQ